MNHNRRWFKWLASRPSTFRRTVRFYVILHFKACPVEVFLWTSNFIHDHYRLMAKSSNKNRKFILSQIRPRGRRTPLRPLWTKNYRSTVRIRPWGGRTNPSGVRLRPLRTKVSRSAVRIRPWDGRTPPSGVRLRPLRTKVNRSAVRFRPWGGRSRRKSSVRRPSPSGVRLRPRTAVPVPRPLAQTAVWLLWHVNHYINATPTRKLPLL